MTQKRCPEEVLTTSVSETAQPLHKTLDEYLKQLIQPSLLQEAALYSLFSGGKRLRPELLLRLISCLGGDSTLGMSTASAIEMIHAYSLIHDDLPCMDDDTMRRGKPTLHCVYGEGIAVLTGDFLLTYSFEVVAKDLRLNANQKVRLLLSLTKQAGAFGMVGGQFEDIQLTKTCEWHQLLSCYKKKTAALFVSAAECATIIAESPLSLTDLGEAIGLAYQLQDDLLDEKEDTFSAVTLFGKERTKEELLKQIQRVDEELQKIPHETASLREFVHSFLSLNF